jgi:hypothetical protein
MSEINHFNAFKQSNKYPDIISSNPVLIYVFVYDRCAQKKRRKTPGLTTEKKQEIGGVAL